MSGIPFSQQGRIGNPKSTAAVRPCSAARRLICLLCFLTLRRPILAPYPPCAIWACWITTVNTLREENVWYQDIDRINGRKTRRPLAFPLRGNVTLGFRQLANARWPATPLYTLSINSAELAKAIAGDGVLNDAACSAEAASTKARNLSS